MKKIIYGLFVVLSIITSVKDIETAKKKKGKGKRGIPISLEELSPAKPSTPSSSKPTTEGDSISQEDEQVSEFVKDTRQYSDDFISDYGEDIQRGGIYLVNFSEGRRKIRAEWFRRARVVVVSNNDVNQDKSSKTIIVVPLTSVRNISDIKKYLSDHPRKCIVQGVDQQEYVLHLDHLSSIDKSRLILSEDDEGRYIFLQKLGTIVFESLQSCLRKFLDLDGGGLYFPHVKEKSEKEKQLKRKREEESYIASRDSKIECNGEDYSLSNLREYYTQKVLKKARGKLTQAVLREDKSSKITIQPADLQHEPDIYYTGDVVWVDLGDLRGKVYGYEVPKIRPAIVLQGNEDPAGNIIVLPLSTKSEAKKYGWDVNLNPIVEDPDASVQQSRALIYHPRSVSPLRIKEDREKDTFLKGQITKNDIESNLVPRIQDALLVLKRKASQKKVIEEVC